MISISGKSKSIDGVGYRYGLETLPHDTSRRELLAFFSLDESQRIQLRKQARRAPNRLVLAMQRIMCTIVEGDVPASQIIRKLSSFGRKHPLFKAFRHIGRLVRTRHILDMAVDLDYRRRILQGLNKGEHRNSLVRELRYARRGTIREADPDMRLCTATCLNLVVLCIAIWNTVHMQKIIRNSIGSGEPIAKSDISFTSPFIYSHLNFYGQFSFRPVPKYDSSIVAEETKPLEGLL